MRYFLIKNITIHYLGTSKIRYTVLSPIPYIIESKFVLYDNFLENKLQSM